ncbi:MAG: hypothetical protein JO023_13130 [Chloroflexi bacterium]|nr:hypothetical protein [Chloroflexota bacterium]
MCVACVMGAAAGFGLLQTYRYVVKDRATNWLSSVRGRPVPDGPPPADAEPAAESPAARELTAPV